MGYCLENSGKSDISEVFGKAVANENREQKNATLVEFRIPCLAVFSFSINWCRVMTALVPDIDRHVHQLAQSTGLDPDVVVLVMIAVLSGILSGAMRIAVSDGRGEGVGQHLVLIAEEPSRLLNLRNVLLGPIYSYQRDLNQQRLEQAIEAQLDTECLTLKMKRLARVAAGVLSDEEIGRDEARLLWKKARARLAELGEQRIPWAFHEYSSGRSFDECIAGTNCGLLVSWFQQPPSLAVLERVFECVDRGLPDVGSVGVCKQFSGRAAFMLTVEAHPAPVETVGSIDDGWWKAICERAIRFRETRMKAGALRLSATTIPDNHGDRLSLRLAAISTWLCHGNPRAIDGLLLDYSASLIDRRVVQATQRSQAGKRAARLMAWCERKSLSSFTQDQAVQALKTTAAPHASDWHTVLDGLVAEGRLTKSIRGGNGRPAVVYSRVDWTTCVDGNVA